MMKSHTDLLTTHKTSANLVNKAQMDYFINRDMSIYFQLRGESYLIDEHVVWYLGALNLTSH